VNQRAMLTNESENVIDRPRRCGGNGVRAWKVLIVALLATAGPGPQASGTETIVVQPPGALVSNAFPFTSRDIRWQQVYDDSLFGASPMRIVSFAFLAESENSISYGSDLVIRMSTTSKEPGSLSSEFAANIGPDQTTVLSGPISLTNALNSWTTVDLTTSFNYNPSAGNLLIEVIHGQSISGSTLPMVAYQPRPGTLQRLHAVSTLPGGGPPFTIGVASGFGELVTRFEVEVPEPGSAVLAFAAVASLASRRRRLPRRAACRAHI